VEDRELDADSRYPGSHHFEKMTAGLYMGNLARLIILRRARVGCYLRIELCQCSSQVQCNRVMALTLEAFSQVGTGGRPLWWLRAAAAAGGVHSVDPPGAAARPFTLVLYAATTGCKLFAVTFLHEIMQDQVGLCGVVHCSSWFDAFAYDAQMELIHEDTSDDRHDVAAILQEQFEISAEQAPLDVRLQVRPSSPHGGPLVTSVASCRILCLSDRRQ
jgi:Hexokinase